MNYGERGEYCIIHEYYEAWQNNNEMENNINLNLEKKILIRISAIAETIRIRPIRICNVEKIGIH